MNEQQEIINKIKVLCENIINDNKILIQEFHEDPSDFICGNEDDAWELGKDLGRYYQSEEILKIINNSVE